MGEGVGGAGPRAAVEVGPTRSAAATAGTKPAAPLTPKGDGEGGEAGGSRGGGPLKGACTSTAGGVAVAVEYYEPPLKGRAAREPPIGLAALQQTRDSSPVSPRKAGGGMAGGGGSPRERKTPKSPSWAIVEGQSPSSPIGPQSTRSPKATAHDAGAPVNSAHPSSAPPSPGGAEQPVSPGPAGSGMRRPEALKTAGGRGPGGTDGGSKAKLVPVGAVVKEDWTLHGTSVGSKAQDTGERSQSCVSPCALDSPASTPTKQGEAAVAREHSRPRDGSPGGSHSPGRGFGTGTAGRRQMHKMGGGMWTTTVSTTLRKNSRLKERESTWGKVEKGQFQGNRVTAAERVIPLQTCPRPNSTPGYSRLLTSSSEPTDILLGLKSASRPMTAQNDIGTNGWGVAGGAHFSPQGVTVTGHSGDARTGGESRGLMDMTVLPYRAGGEEDSKSVEKHVTVPVLPSASSKVPARSRVNIDRLRAEQIYQERVLGGGTWWAWNAE